MGYLDNAGLAHLWGKIRAALSGFMPVKGRQLSGEQDEFKLYAGEDDPDYANVMVSVTDQHVNIDLNTEDNSLHVELQPDFAEIRAFPGGSSAISVDASYGITIENLSPSTSISYAFAYSLDGLLVKPDGSYELNLNQIIKKCLSGIVPTGVITMWSGASTAIPTGWALCNGSNGTPDLRNRFVVGAGGTYTVGASGGEAAHTLTVSEMPRHYHELGGERGIGQVYSETNGPLWLATDDLHDAPDPETDYAGGSQPHNNLPPYYALCYIMKL